MRLPTPDYDDYFDALRASTLSNLIRPGLLAESSRGCWWGEKSHCTFCGLNGTGMKYRSKSPERVLTELAELSRRYGVSGIQFVDNILDMSYFRHVLPRLAAAGGRYALFYETKANLKREQVELLADAGRALDSTRDREPGRQRPSPHRQGELDAHEPPAS